jgi:hypothetical protein
VQFFSKILWEQRDFEALRQNMKLNISGAWVYYWYHISREGILYIRWHLQHGAFWHESSATAYVMNLRVVSIQCIYLWPSNVQLYRNMNSLVFHRNIRKSLWHHCRAKIPIPRRLLLYINSLLLIYDLIGVYSPSSTVAESPDIWNLGYWPIP